MIGLFALVLGLSCGGLPPTPGKTSSPAIVQAVLLPDPGLALERPAAPPFSLTSSDGVGLKIAAVDATTVIEDPVAVTELKLVFENPEARTIEGRFTFTVPQGASLSRLAMRINGSLMEGEVVEKQRARITYEEFLHQRRDPALLEQGAGNEIAVRVFPIAAHEKKEIVVTYAETLSRKRPFKLRFAGLPTVEKLDVRIYSGGVAVAERHAAETTKPSDLLLAPEHWSKSDDAGIRADGAALVRVRVPDTAATSDPVSSAVVLVDTSASRALDLGQELEALRQVVASMRPDAGLTVACFDQQVVPIFSGAAKDFGAAQLSRIEKRGALGASDLAAALAWAREAGKSLSAPRLVLVTDGVVTVGAKDQAELRRLASTLQDVGFARADAVVVGGIREEETLAAITKGALPRAGALIAAEDGANEISRRLSSNTLAVLPVRVDGADWVYPSVVQGAQPGDEITVAVEAKKLPATIDFGAFSAKPVYRDGSGPLVARSVALAKIASIEAGEGSVEEKRTKIVPISVRHRIVSDHTAMIVLETEQDYDRFSIDRKANVDVLGIVDGRIAVQSVPRGRPIGTAGANEALAASGAGPGVVDRGDVDGIGLGSIGAIGHGAGTGTGQGFGSGSGRLGGSHRSRAPAVRMGATSVSGRLPPEIVQRIVRQNFGRFRRCYESALGPSSNLSGRVTIRFVIGRDGAVGAAHDAGSTLGNPRAIRCIENAFKALSFPVPEGGPVTVVYPILFGSEVDEVTAAPLGMGSRPSRIPTLPPPVDPLPQPNNEYEGRFAQVMAFVEKKDTRGALMQAIAWRAEAPGEVLAYLALGEAAELANDKDLAARAYGSVLELWSYRVDMVRLAGERLERVGDSKSLELAADAYAAAVADRPDHPTSHRQRAMALLKLDRPAEAFGVLAAALDRSYANGRFAGVETILRDDLALAGLAWAAAEPTKREAIEEKLRRHERSLERAPSLRFILSWETDASDVDLHVGDARGGHAYFGNRSLASGGRLEADVTNGYGPEAFTVEEPPTAYPYRLRVTYFSRGAMGFGMGKVQIIRHEGGGKLSFDERPFVLMKDHAVVDLGEVRGPTKG